MSDEIKNHLVRATVTKVDDSDGIQKVYATGRDGEVYGGQTGVIRLQAFGFDSVPPVGSHGVLLVLNGNNDQAIMLAAEHPDHRIKNKAGGAGAMHDASGQVFHFKDGSEAVMHVKKLTIVSDGPVIIDAPEINLGGPGGTAVLLAGGTEMGHSATKVKGI